MAAQHAKTSKTCTTCENKQNKFAECSKQTTMVAQHTETSKTKLQVGQNIPKWQYNMQKQAK